SVPPARPLDHAPQLKCLRKLSPRDRPCRLIPLAAKDGVNQYSKALPGQKKRKRHTGIHYTITRSARTSSDGRMVRPRALGVLRLMTSSYLVGCSTGRSAGLAPLIMRSTNPAACRAISL